MSTSESSFSSIDPRRLIDRLVDDELSPAERRALVARFEQSPELWRTCALAFLENQAFRSDFLAIQRSTESPHGEAAPPPRPFPVRIDPVTAPSAAPGSPAPSVTVPAVSPTVPLAPEKRSEPRPSGRPRMFSPSGWSAVAAGVLLSFTIGATTGPWAQRHFFPEAVESAGPKSSPAASGGTSGPSSAPISVYDLTLARDPVDGRRTELNLPVVEAPGWDEKALLALPSGVSPEVRRQLESLGENLGEERQLMPVTLSNGQTVLIPVDQVRVRPRTRPLQ